MDTLEQGEQVDLNDRTTVRRKAEDEFSLTARLSREGVGLDREDIRRLAEIAGFDVS